VSFVLYNPVRYNDPTGHCLVLCTAIIGGLVGAAVDFSLQVAGRITKGDTFSEAVRKVDYKEVAVSTVAGIAAGATMGLLSPAVAAVGPAWTGAANFASGAASGIVGGQVGALTDAGLVQLKSSINGQPLNGNQFWENAHNAGFGDPAHLVYEGMSGGIVTSVSQGIVNGLTETNPLYLGQDKVNSAFVRGAEAGIMRNSSETVEDTVSTMWDYHWSHHDDYSKGQ
jgi:hypothetical protein